ncbi:unnamed protein product, partial [Mesorhabditis belari]|uniref:Glutamate-rich WD repeat-containing protein 1 n=1 Tax=Mesorhabditis belari TaxID=2138241 RepID=A0AAF3E954_9BILA
MSDIEMDDIDEDVGEEGEETKEEKKPKVYVPGVSRELKEGEELEFDPDAYQAFHSFETTWPCMSFSILRDSLGDNRTDFPMQMYLVSGSHADKPKNAEISVIGLKNLTGTKQVSHFDEEDEESDGNQPILHSVTIPQNGNINRMKAERLGDANVVALWNAFGKVQLWNITDAMKMIDGMTGKSANSTLSNQKPLFSYSGHNREGFALSWSRVKTGSLASGGEDRNIYNWHLQEGGSWVVDHRPYKGHKGSVEDIEWSPTEEGLLISCGSDKTIRLWDTRISPTEACVCIVENAHDDDVNVISWNPSPTDPFILSGGDDSALKIWSLQTIQYGRHVANFKYHTRPITSVEWHPNDSTTFMASAEDDQVSIWDVAMEADTTEDVVEGVPPQLLFLHCGQKEVKEVHWHQQCPGLALTTALSGFNTTYQMRLGCLRFIYGGNKSGPEYLR